MKLKFNNKILIAFFFLSYLILGLNIFKDYGVSFDEETSRLYGLTNGNYILKKFLNEEKYNNLFNSITENKFKVKISKKKPTELDKFPDRAYGAAFELPLAALEILFNIKDEKNVFLFRHLINFLFFFTSCIYFFFLLKKIFKKDYIAFFGVLLLITNPRIFANSFYNSKDIIFLSFFIISNFYGYNLLSSKNKSDLLFFCFFSACLINIRLIGIIVPVLICFIIFLYDLKNKKLFNTKIIQIIFLTSIFLYLIWPFLWEDTINKLIFIYNYFSNLNPLDSMYNGELLQGDRLPWHYLPVWILITSPSFITILFIFGLIFLIANLKKKLNFDKIYLSCSLCLFLGLPLFYVIFSNLSLYDGWRHFYFFYPVIIKISLISFYYFFGIKNSFIKKTFFTFFIVFLLHSVYTIYKLHPHQYLYFNNLIVKNGLKNFEKDYWGLSNKIVLEQFLEKNKKGEIIYSFHGSMFPTSLLAVHKTQRKRFIKFSEVSSSYDGPIYYFINNRDKIDYDKINKHSDVVFEFIFNGVLINGVYKFDNVDNLNRAFNE